MNSEAFTPEDIEKGMLTDLLNYLLNYNKQSDRKYYDIHIGTDGYCTIVEWETRFYEHDEDTGFIYIDSEHEVLKRVLFPDNHYEYLPDDEVEEAFEDWLKDNPGWKKSEYSNSWYNEKEEEYARQMMESLRTSASKDEEEDTDEHTE